ncbi:VWA domain-containing protein [Acerihabitans sp. TG2]|uniref:VWA domain-containing protein n=1 Tax=Acerihabitans sp. TG2 TaxID=3096008 RepID=UPI002B236E3F|nr:VWA domain-containing protein [Acerihabitans sp. TG2]MEA9391533.1 VWA domain-containing protein [Acerihabitans sp. TG2]
MNRIARQTTELRRAESALAGYNRLMALLHQHLPARIAMLYARPGGEAGHVIEWSSDINGQPQPITSLQEGESQKVRHSLLEKLTAVRQLADTLAAQPDHDEQDIQLLRQASNLPDDANVYSLNGQPVITCWGEKPLPDLPPVVPLNAPQVNPEVVPPSVAPLLAVAPRRWRRWWWLLLLLLLLLCALLAWWFWPRALPPAPAVIAPAPVVIPPVPVVEPPAPVAAAPLPNVDPPVELPKPIIEPPVAVKPETPAVKPPTPKVPVVQLSVTEQCIVDEKKAGRAANAEKKCKTRFLDSVKSLCPKERPAELAPQVVVVFDASGSMAISMDASELEQAMWENRIPVPNIDREPRRISAARTATTEIIRRLPSDMNVAMVTAESCSLVRTSAFFSLHQRPELIRTINRIEPGGKTALANALRQAGQRVDGVNRDAIILLVSDGAETCGGDPCAVARELKRIKPRLVVNVVDIKGAGAGNCVAQSTGGKVFTANHANEMSAMMNRAIESYIPKNCLH